MTRNDVRPPLGGGSEKETLVGFLDYLREGVARNAEGAPEPAVRTAGVESGTSVLGLVKHLTSVERFLFLGEEVRSWPSTMRPVADDTVESVVAAYREAVRLANEAIAGWSDLEAPQANAVSGRWLLVHMVEETARHAGHADILREQIDGATGR
ncbi:DinB family protein [Kribbella antibiotica]|uniref:DinB family protein n=1 Tax=Kribbella antibiotica TaxID=190195 RepID=A0A4R4ZIR8_9ACTN|nr:DinB family protein [Kribbella antibiotica]TDD57409.1 DinB family protein [Kribbella antibiotica]